MDRHTSIKRISKFIVLFVALLFSITATAKDLLILLSEDQSIHNEMATIILRETNLSGSIQVYHEDSLPNSDSEALLIIAIGTRACDRVIEKYSSTEIVICTLIPAQTYRALLTKHKKTEAHEKRLTAIFMDQPISRQIALARLVFPDARSIGTVFGQTSVLQRYDFEQYAEKENFETHHAFLDQSQNPVQILTPVIQRSDIFLAIPDNANFNRSVSRWALYISLRNKVPLIGFSPSYSEAGAVISLYSTPKQLAYQTSDIVLNYLVNHKLAPASYPLKYETIINESTARTLRMNLQNSQYLSEQLKEIHK